MTWPANSSDLNSIGHVWDALGRAIAMHQLSPRTILELKIALVEKWEDLPQALHQSIINNMHTRCALVVQRQHTLYKPHFYCQLLSLSSDYIGFIGNRSCQ